MTDVAHDEPAHDVPAPAGTTTTIHLVPHTHWDREWYEPFQTFRMRLVELVDDVLARMEAEPRFRFTLDGQLATVDDYLEIRPGAEDRIRRYVTEGRLAIGPWLILMDEFLVSGETIVRNLQAGWARAREMGGAMPIGYLPDMFGHIAQMPQILRRAGIGDAVVWRGIPAAVERNHFRWRAPDGSEVRAEYLVGGYGQAAYLFAVPDRLPRKVAAYHEAMRSFYGDRSVLAMYGTDHAAPVPEMVELVDVVNASPGRHRVAIETLAEYVEAARAADEDDPALVVGEMRSGARANVLMGVASAHMDIKAAAGRAERWLERYAEPFSALYADRWPAVPLALAWRRVIENSAHDSICGCSVDAVAGQVLTRYAEAEQIARGLAERAVAGFARTAAADAWVAFNPSPVRRGGLVELALAVPESWESVALRTPEGALVATQEITRNRPLLYRAAMPAAELLHFLARRLHGRELFGRQLNGVAIERIGGSPTLTLHLDDDADPPSLDVDDLRREVEVAVSAAATEEWHVRAVAVPRRTVCAVVNAPPLGTVALRAVESHGARDEAVAGLEYPVTASPDRLANGLIEVTVEPAGTLRIAVPGGPAFEGVGRIVDGGDFGDSYDYGPPADDLMIESPIDLRTELTAAGPVVGELAVTRTYRWPLGLAADGSHRGETAADVPVRMAVSLRAGEPFVRIRLAFENPAIDHRVRFHIPLPEPAEGSAAEGQFAVVERGLTLEGGHGEVPLPTYPARGFVAAGGIAALLEHITEYEVVDGRELALTLLRSTGLISRNDNPYREDPAGPERAVPAAQLRGPWSIGFGLFPFTGSWDDADVVAQSERYACEFLAARGGNVAGRAATGAVAPVMHLAAATTGTVATSALGLTLEGRGVVLCALLRRDDWLEVRVVAETGRSTAAVIGDGILEAREVDLLGHPGAPLAVTGGQVSLELGAWQIRTVQLRR